MTGNPSGLRLRPNIATTLPDRGDEILVERVRSRLGRVIMHPRAIDVMACDGVVTLCGPLSTRESEAAVAAVASTPGVVEVVNRLDPDGAAHAVPAPTLS